MLLVGYQCYGDLRPYPSVQSTNSSCATYLADTDRTS